MSAKFVHLQVANILTGHLRYNYGKCDWKIVKNVDEVDDVPKRESEPFDSG